MKHPTGNGDKIYIFLQLRALITIFLKSKYFDIWPALKKEYFEDLFKLKEYFENLCKQKKYFEKLFQADPLVKGGQNQLKA